MIVLDASVLIAAFRRNQRLERRDEARELVRLIDEDAPLAVPGIAYQEVLAGARSAAHYERLRRLFAGFDVLRASSEAHELAARIAATCRRGGIAATTVDCLIAAQTLTAGGSLFTLDRDFERIARRCGMRLHRWGA